MKQNKDNKQQNKLSGRYEIIEQVGVGGMSYVYKAYDSKKHKIVAIKVLKDELSLDDEFVKKFKSEALASKDIKHKNVISAYDVIDEDNLHYIVMEYFEGTTLNKYIKEHEKLSNEEVVDISLQVARGISAAHNKGIIHRDIKPQNIVINAKHEAKITDFGIARAITSTTKNISVIGTVHYISPEQVRNTKVDFRSDIYSFGCTIYEMITGEVPFSGDTPLEIIISHLRENIKQPHLVNKSIYPSLEKIILKSTRMIPRERYQTIDELIDDLERALSDKEGTFIKDNNYIEDEEGKTVIISDEDMRVIKAVSEKFTNKSSHSNSKQSLTPEQEEFFKKYIKDGAFKHHLMMRRIIYGAVIAVGLLIVLMVFIALDTRHNALKTNLSTKSNSSINILNSLEGIDFELAKNITNEYGIELNIVGEEFNEKHEFGKIVKIVSEDLEGTKKIDVIISKGAKVIDFTNLSELQTIRWTDMMDRLTDRGLDYSVSEIYDNNVPRGYIIGVNKKYSSDPGKLVFTISRGLSEQMKTMPDLYKKSISEARDLLSVNELVLGSISFVRDLYIPENYVISQSVSKGKEVKSGTSVDLVLSCGPDGVEYVAETKNKWYAELSTTYRVMKDNSPYIDSSNETFMLQVRLVQDTSIGTVYTELIEPQEYKVGTIIPLVFTNLEGEEKVQYGQVQVVDVVNDKVLASINVMFWPSTK